MKPFTHTLLIALCLLTFMGGQARAMIAPGKTAQVTIANTTGKPCFFQLEGANGYTNVALDAKGKQTLNIELEYPLYYQYMDGNQKFHSIYLTPGSKTDITETATGVSIQGDHAAINAFINQNRYLGYAAQGVPMYSAQWQDGCRKELAGLCEKLVQEGNLPSDFTKLHTQYYQFAYYGQQLSSPLMATFMKVKLDLPGNYYDFLKTMKLDDANILSLPKWSNTLMMAFSEMEKQGIIPVNKDRFMQIYASKISDEKVRSAFLVQLLNHTLQKGYSDNFPAYLESIRKAIVGDKDLAALKEVEAKYSALKEANKGILKGMPAPAFTAVDVNGKEYKMSDFAGKVLVLDFWFTGCIPCKAEMPFMEKIAESMKGDSILFISMSLDSGAQLMASWKEAVKDNKGPVLNLNVPQGFKSALAQKYGIRSVPRIVIVDKEGKVFESNALRPSDPKLKQTLESLLGKSNPKEEVQKEMMALMQAGTADEQDAILKNALAKFNKIPEVAPMLNMMAFQVIQKYASEKNYEKADIYISKIAPSAYRRDVVFLVGSACLEGDARDKAELYIKEAAQTTVNYQKEKPEDADENTKLSIISGTYGNLLVSQGKLAEAAQWVEQAYGNGERANFELMNSYASVQVFKKEYAKALPVLEKMVKNGMSSDAMKALLKEAYAGNNGSAKGFDKYMSELLKESADKQRKEIKEQMVSEPAPLFALKNLKGESVSLAELKGKVVILDFWATWCGPCKSSFPAMQKAVDKYKNNKEVAFLFIDTWESAKNPQSAVKAFIEEHKYGFNVLFDLKDPETKTCKVIESYGAKGIPAKYIVDKEGNIRFKLVGFSGSDEQAVSELSEMIEILL